MLVEFGRTRVLCAASFTAGVPALAQGPGDRLGHRRVRDAAPLHQHPQRPRVAPGQGRRPHARDLAGSSAAACARSSTPRPWARTPSSSTATSSRPTAAPAPPPSPAPGSPSRTPSPTPAPSGLSRRPREPLTGSIAAVSVGLVDGRPVLDLDYPEDSTAQTDMNVVMTGDGRFVEVQGTAEGGAASTARCSASSSTSPPTGCERLTALQQRGPRRPARGSAWRDPPARPRHPQRAQGPRAAADPRGPRRRARARGRRRRATSPGAPDVAETEVTFLGNARLKAVALAQATGLPAVADDSGLAVDVLGGSPGVFSARWSGSTAGPDAGPRRARPGQPRPAPGAGRRRARTSTAAPPSSAPPSSRCRTAGSRVSRAG